MTKRMLIDATHPEETRVAVVDGNQLEDFDVEVSSRRQLKGNIYLAKVVRVEPSLQAAFVDYGGNRHGFLAFSEIHPDYFQIPVSDRSEYVDDVLDDDEYGADIDELDPDELDTSAPSPDALIDADVTDEAGKEAGNETGDETGDESEFDTEGGENDPKDEEEEEEEEGSASYPFPRIAIPAASPSTARIHEDTSSSSSAHDGEDHDSDDSDEGGETSEEAPDTAAATQHASAADDGDEKADPATDDDVDTNTPVETIGGDESDEVESTQKRRSPNPRNYKIQEVIKRRQVLLVQVVKEERGNKGAALTTYMSLAGRYCVLMPNTSRGGGISRKITNSADRKTLKAILSSLSVPDGMAVILRTAGIGRTKAEIKRDFEYLIRLWNTVRDLTLKSTAPTLVHEESDIVRRSIRDLYTRDISEVMVEGDHAYRSAKDFMKLLIPSHARKVKQYKDSAAPLFRSAGVEAQLDAIHNPVVHLPAGGYLVINPTEALVSIDVNSGRSTKERNIEETALKTNLEAADELARQLRLRDLAGLVVIDFIDMDVHRNNAQVERRLKEALKHDRARIQVGRISPFGLLEMSRQRLRPSLIETSSEPCPHCGGTGTRRSTESTALVVLRAIDEEGANRRASELTVHVPTSVALYILNHKRDALAELQAKYDMTVLLSNDDSLIPPDLRLERTRNLDGEIISEMVATVRPEAVEDPGRKRRRRRRIRKRDDDLYTAETEIETETEMGTVQAQDQADDNTATADDGDEQKGRRRRRSRRGGRRRRKSADGVQDISDNGEAPATDDLDTQVEVVADETSNDEEKPKRRRSRRRRKPSDEGESSETVEATPTDGQALESDEKPKRRRRPRNKAGSDEKKDGRGDDSAAEVSAQASPDGDTDGDEDTAKPRRSRTRKKAETPDESTPAPTEAASPPPAAQSSADEAPKSHPGVETVVVGEVQEKPKRKGWWNLGR